METLKEFYSSILELPVLLDGKKQILIRVGSSDLIFMETKTIEPVYHFAFNIPANKIEEAKEWLSYKVKLLWMDDYKNDIANFVNWNAKSVYFYDPAGNILELIARFDLNNENDETFSSKQFLSINEVGLVFSQENFERRNAELQTLYSLPYFSKQPPLPQFRAIGDDEGLFVVVPEHRNWFPTDKPAGMFPLDIHIVNNGRNYTLKLNDDLDYRGQERHPE
jgi:hypothetical protein